MTIEVDLDRLDRAELGELARRLDLRVDHRREPRHPGGGEVELPVEWRRGDPRDDVHARWGDDDDTYEPFTPYEGVLPSGSSARLAIGRCFRDRKSFAEERLYFIVMAIGPAEGLESICEFVSADDHERTREVVSIVKGKDGSARQFDRPSELPAIYRNWRTEAYNERVAYPGAFTKQALVCHEDDHEGMLNHALAQIQLRDLY